jgi:hypothetical protein
MRNHGYLAFPDGVSIPSQCSPMLHAGDSALRNAPNKECYAMSDKPLIVSWKGLRAMGWPYSRAHTWRMMYDPDYADNRGVIPHVAWSPAPQTSL